MGMLLEPATFRGSCGTAAAPGTAGFQWRPRGSFWRQPSLALCVGGECWGETESVSPRKSLETLKHGTLGPAATCCGSGKNLKPGSAASLSERTVVAQTPEMLPKYRMLDAGPYRLAHRGLAIPATGDRERSPLCLSLAGLDGEKSGLQGILALGCSLFPAERAAVSWSVGGYRRQSLERLWLQPPPPLVGAGSGGGSHQGVTAPEAPPAAARALHKSLLATRSPHPTGDSHPSRRRPQQSTRRAETPARQPR